MKLSDSVSFRRFWLKSSAPCGYLTPTYSDKMLAKRIGVRFSRFEGRCFCFVHPVGRQRAVLQQRLHYLDPLAVNYVSLAG